jgi:predicted nucleotidyltransferase
MPTALELTSEEIAMYQANARRQHDREAAEVAIREQRAWELARQAAALLRERFGATRVVVFGSLVHKGCFTAWSDVDIAAWNIHPDDTFRAMGMVMDIDAEIEINLVDVATCRSSLLATIEREGLDI